MEFYRLNKRELAFYQQTLERNLESLTSRDDVIGVGVGFKTVNGLATDTMCLLVSVKEKQDDIPAAQRIPETIDGVPTDVIVEQFVELQIKGELPKNRFEKYQTLMGGAAIINCNTDEGYCGVLGAIVFLDGRAMGLSVQHAIGSQVKLKARKNDPIIQPPYPRVDPSEAIGTLYDFDEKLDVALISLNESRSYAAKMMCDDGDFELVEPKIGMPTLEVECSAVHTHTRGTIFSRKRTYRNGQWIWEIEIDFDEEYVSTQAGDSGAVWVDRKTKAPVGLHHGVVKVLDRNQNPVRNADGNIKKRAVATCIMDLKKWHDFTFRPPKKRVPNQMNEELRVYETGFATSGSDLFAFCYLPPSTDNLHKPVLIKKFDSSLQKIGEVNSGLYPLSALEPCVFHGSIYAAWRTPIGDRIAFANLIEKNTTSGNPFELASPTNLDLATRRKPTLESHGDKIVLAYSDKSTQKIRIAFSSNGSSWDSYTIENASTRFSPALASHNGKLVLAWVELDFKINLVEIDPSSKSRYVDDKYILGGKSSEDLSLVSNGSKLSLAYTNKGNNQLMVVEGANRRALFGTPTTKSDVARTSAPVLFYFDGKMFCHRPSTSLVSRQFLAASSRSAQSNS